MNTISYLPGASYEEQLRIWANGNEDEHRLAVFLEENVTQYVEAASDDSRQEGREAGYSEGRDAGYSEGYDAGYSEGYAEGRDG